MYNLGKLTNTEKEKDTPIYINVMWGLDPPKPQRTGASKDKGNKKGKKNTKDNGKAKGKEKINDRSKFKEIKPSDGSQQLQQAGEPRQPEQPRGPESVGGPGQSQQSGQPRDLSEGPSSYRSAGPSGGDSVRPGEGPISGRNAGSLFGPGPTIGGGFVHGSRHGSVNKHSRRSETSRQSHRSEKSSQPHKTHKSQLSNIDQRNDTIYEAAKGNGLGQRTSQALFIANAFEPEDNPRNPDNRAMHAPNERDLTYHGGGQIIQANLQHLPDSRHSQHSSISRGGPIIQAFLDDLPDSRHSQRSSIASRNTHSRYTNPVGAARAPLVSEGSSPTARPYQPQQQLQHHYQLVGRNSHARSSYAGSPAGGRGPARPDSYADSEAGYPASAVAYGESAGGAPNSNAGSAAGYGRRDAPPSQDEYSSEESFDSEGSGSHVSRQTTIYIRP